MSISDYGASEYIERLDQLRGLGPLYQEYLGFEDGWRVAHVRVRVGSLHHWIMNRLRNMALDNRTTVRDTIPPTRVPR